MEHKPLDLVGFGKGKVRRMFIKIDESKKKDAVISIFYVFLFISWAIRTFPASKELLAYIHTTYYLLLGFWTLEMLVKIGAFYDKFFKNYINVVMLVHYLGSFISMFFWWKDKVLYPYFPVILSLRLLWMFKVFLFIESLKKTIRIFYMALPSFISLILVIYIIAYIYALIGMELFGYLTQTGDGIDKDSNFTHFGAAIMTLFRVSVGENWQDVLIDLQRGIQANYICNNFSNSYENYKKYGLSKCGSTISGYVFLTSFYMIVSFIFFNILIAILLEAFEIAHNQEETFIK
jgi:Ion transport protein